MYNKSELEKCLALLGQRLEVEGSSSLSLFVCGGSALILTGFVSRTTKDVDVVAIGYAAVDHGPGKHVDDLLELKPSEEEMASAARWGMTHDYSEAFRATLKDMLEKIGYEEVAQRI